MSPISHFSFFFAESDLDDLIDEIIKTNNRGVSIGRNGSAVASWSFGQSFFFSSTVVTTIGYGHQTPLSPEGKFFCILYALIGIPMTMLLITAVVDKLMTPVNLLLIWINNTMGHLYSPFSLRLFHLLLVIYFSKKFRLHKIFLFQKNTNITFYIKTITCLYSCNLNLWIFIFSNQFELNIYLVKFWWYLQLAIKSSFAIERGLEW